MARATIQHVSSARKPVIARKLTRDLFAGYANAEFSFENSALELLDTSGKLIQLEWSTIKWLCWVRELEPAGSFEQENPERLLRRRFASRPRLPGLWLRLVLKDGDELEGVAANDRSLIESMGLLLTPPDTRSNTQRIFVPRTSIRELTILAVITPPKDLTSRSSFARGQASLQPELFDKEN